MKLLIYFVRLTIIIIFYTLPKKYYNTWSSFGSLRFFSSEVVVCLFLLISFVIFCVQCNSCNSDRIEWLQLKLNLRKRHFVILSSRGYFWMLSLHFSFVVFILRVGLLFWLQNTWNVGGKCVDCFDYRSFRCRHILNTRAFMFSSQMSRACVCVCANRNIAATRLGFHINFDVYPSKEKFHREKNSQSRSKKSNKWN